MGEIPKEDCTKLLESLAGAEDEDGFFLTLHSWTNCAASKSNKPHPRSYQKTFLKKYIISNSSKICVITSTLGQKHGGPKNRQKNRKYFLGTERHLIKMKIWESEVANFLI